MTAEDALKDLWPSIAKAFLRGREDEPTPAARELVKTLAALAEKHARWQEERCNRELQAWEERSEQELEAIITEVAKALGAKRVTFSGDPRGLTVHLHFEDGRYNTWGGEEEGMRL